MSCHQNAGQNHNVVVIWQRRGWEDNIKMHLTEIGQEGVGRIRMAQDRDWCWTL
jgi:hypothetical protein